MRLVLIVGLLWTTTFSPALAAAPAVTPTTAKTPTPGGVLTVQGALRDAMKYSPMLAIAVLDLRRAKLQVRSEDYRYVTRFSASAGYTHNANPSLRTQGDTEIGQSDAVALGFGFAHQFSFGMQLGVDVELGGSGRREVEPGEAALSLGPGYEVSVRLSATQPLLRGMGDDVGEAGLRQAQFAVDAATQARHRSASELARDVIGSYWELWYAQTAEAIQADAVAVAKRQLAESQARAEAGRIPALSVLPLRTAVATAEERYVSALTSTRKVRVSLSRKLGKSMLGAVVKVDETGPPQDDTLPDRTSLLERAIGNAYQLKELKASVDQARESVVVASNAALPQLDAVAWMSVAGLGNNDVPQAFEMFGTFAAVSGFVGLQLELPVVNAVARSQQEQAVAVVNAAQERLRDGKDAVTEAVMLQLATLTEAIARLASASKTAALSSEVASGQKKRFVAGAGTALELVVAEQDRSAAELRVARARTDVAIERAKLRHLTGQLLSDVIPDA